MGFNLVMFGFFAILSYVISSLASITFVEGLHVSGLEKIQLTATCVLYMAGAWFTLKEAFKVKSVAYDGDKPKIQYIHTSSKRFCYIGLYLICTFFSIFTTANMAFQAINRDTTYKVQSSDAYVLNKAQKDAALAEITANTKEIESLIEQRNKAVNAQLKLADGWKATRIKERRNEINKSEAIASEYDAKIARIRNSNNSRQSIVNSPLPSSAEATPSGKSLIDVFGISEKTMMIIVAVAVMILSLGVDLLGAFFTIQYSFQSYLYKSGKSNSVSRPRPENRTITAAPKFEASPIMAKKENIIGFRPEPKSGIDKETKQKYIETMMKSRKANGAVDGYERIAKTIGINREDARAIRNELERDGVVKTVGTRTVIV